MEYETPYGELHQTLDEMLDQAKKHPFRVPMDFETRYRVWNENILPERIQQVEKTMTANHARRMYDLSYKDVLRLAKRSEREFFEVVNNPRIAPAHLKTAQSLYQQRKTLLARSFKFFVETLNEIAHGGR
jgi:hypothetical protein